MFLLILLAASLTLIMLPTEAWAWGPIAHLDYAAEALKSLSLYPSAVKVLLTRFPNDFLYGAVAADITVGKDYVDYIYNCHNWRMGFLILNEAKDGRQSVVQLRSIPLEETDQDVTFCKTAFTDISDASSCAFFSLYETSASTIRFARDASPSRITRSATWCARSASSARIRIVSSSLRAA